MALSLVVAPATDPVSLVEAKAHLRVQTDDDDALIVSLVSAATEYVETFTHRALISQTWDLRLDGFPWLWSTTATDERLVDLGAIWLPKAPLVSVTSVTYIDMNGVTQTWAASNYTVDAPAGPKARPGRLVPAWSIYYPVTRAVPNAVTVRFVAGYGSTADAVPASVKAAIKLMLAHWFDNRSPVVVSESRATELEIPRTVDALLWPYKAF